MVTISEAGAGLQEREPMSNKEPYANEELLDDDGTRLIFWKPSKEDRVFRIVMADEGGYSSVCCTKEDWEELKQKVDSCLERFHKLNDEATL